ncbi:MAG TPA: hypothetical protein VK524_00220, partial [Polyangiaceae bacterium]|nr:hypothetical protein [Polyangiaceae bacterium]
EGIDKSEDKAREREKAKQKPKPADEAPQAAPRDKDKAARPAKDGGGDGDVLFSFDSNDTSEPEPKPKGPVLPVRVFGDSFKLDITIGGGYRGWYPQQYDAVDVNVASYATWSVDVKAKLFKFLSLRRGYYESNGASAPRTEEAAVAAQIGSYAPKAAWLLGVVGVPISKVWEPQIRYESRAFDTRARPHRPVCVVPRDAPEDLQGCVGTMEDLKIISTFETFVAGVRYDHSKTGGVVVEQKGAKIPPLFFGIGLMQYRKPYQLNVDGFTLDDYLFDGRFRGAGLALGADIGGGLDRFFAEADMQLGIGEVSLTSNITLNELVPGDKLIGYVQGTAGLGYRWPIIRAAPTLILVPVAKLGGASFFLVDTASDESDMGTTTSPSVNWDLLWSLQVSLLLPL